MPSLITTVRNKFLEAIRSVNPPGRWKILVVDEHSQKLLGSVLKQFDILEENVTLIESITSHRDEQPGFEAIYLLMATTQNVDRVIRDFSGGRQQYAGAHLFFIDGLPDPLFERLTQSAAEPFLKGLQDLFVNFWAIEAQAFSLKLPQLFFSFYSPPRTESAFKVARNRVEEDVTFVAKRLANLCITLNEYPYIRYYMPSHHPPLGALKPTAAPRPPPPSEGSGRWRTNLARGDVARAWESVETDYVTRLLAFKVQGILDDYRKATPDFPARTENPRPRGTLIITDRSMDMVAPFVHEFTYQAMCNDLLPIEDGAKYLYKFQSSVGAYENKVATLSDEDSVWTEVRHMHMREAIDKLMADFNKFLQENAGFQQGEGAASLNDMKDMLASLPQYQEQREKFSLHLNMAQDCMSIFEKDKLPAVANVEQNCATGVTSEGKTPKTLVEEMVPLLDSREVMNLSKVRIIALYVQYRDGVPDEDRRRLYQHARLSMPEQDAINALVHMGVRISRGPKDGDSRKKNKQKPSGEEEYELSRFKPAVKFMLEDHSNGKLDMTQFPYVKDMPGPANAAPSLRAAPSQATSLRSAKPSWHRAAKPGASQSDNKQRTILFVAGGMTYSEMREVYHLSESLNKEIIIGSTHTSPPRQFIDDLKVLELGGVGSRAVPNGLQDANGPRPFQEYYDEKYFTRDAPPPQKPAAAPQVKQTKSASSSVKTGGPINLQDFAGSTISVNSVTGEKEKEKKKKKGLFRF